MINKGSKKQFLAYNDSEIKQAKIVCANISKAQNNQMKSVPKSVQIINNSKIPAGVMKSVTKIVKSQQPHISQVPLGSD